MSETIVGGPTSAAERSAEKSAAPPGRGSLDAASSQPESGSIKWQGYIPIGGIQQWITITGADRRNPVVLFLHGGPGIAGSPFAEAGYAGWEKDFTLVQWDQRGAGRTFAKNREAGASTITVERMTLDGIEVAEYLRKSLGKKKIILTGGSWGSVLGIQMAHVRPDLFYAFAGVSQGTSWSRNEAASYARVRQIALAKDDRQALATLDDVGPPPWHSSQEKRPFRQLQIAYQRELATAPPPPLKISDEYADDFKNGTFQAAGDFSNSLFFGPTLTGLIFGVDITSLTDFRIPIYMIQGEFDLTIPPEEARAYFDSIRAPKKKFLIAPGSGHEPTAVSQDMLRELLLEEVRPLATR